MVQMSISAHIARINTKKPPPIHETAYAIITGTNARGG